MRREFTRINLKCNFRVQKEPHTNDLCEVLVPARPRHKRACRCMRIVPKFCVGSALGRLSHYFRCMIRPNEVAFRKMPLYTAITHQTKVKQEC